MSSESQTSRTHDGERVDDGIPAGDRLDVLGNDCSRTILAATQDGPLTAKELTALTDCSSATVYRRINDLIDSDLLEECIRFESGGSHTTAYRAIVSTLRVEIGSEGITLSVRETTDE